MTNHASMSVTTQTAITHDKQCFSDSVTTQTAITQHDKQCFNDSVKTQTAITQTTLQRQYDDSNCDNTT